MKKGVLMLLILGVLILSTASFVSAQDFCAVFSPYLKEKCQLICNPMGDKASLNKCLDGYQALDKSLSPMNADNLRVLEKGKEELDSCLENNNFIFDDVSVDIFKKCLDETKDLPLGEDTTLDEVAELPNLPTEESKRESILVVESKRGTATNEVDAIVYPRKELWEITFNIDKENRAKLVAIPEIVKLAIEQNIDLTKNWQIVTSAACNFRSEGLASCVAGGPLFNLLLVDGKDCNQPVAFKFDFAPENNWIRKSQKIDNELSDCITTRVSDKCTIHFDTCFGFGSVKDSKLETVQKGLEKEVERFTTPIVSTGGATFDFFYSTGKEKVSAGFDRQIRGDENKLRLELDWEATRQKVWADSEEPEEFMNIQKLIKISPEEIAKVGKGESLAERGLKTLLSPVVWVSKKVIVNPLNWLYGKFSSTYEKYVSARGVKPVKVAKVPTTDCEFRKLGKYLGFKQCAELEKPKVTLADLDVKLSPAEQACLISSGWKNGADEFLTASIREQVVVFDKINADRGCKNIQLVEKLQNMVARYLVLTNDEKKEPGYKSAVLRIRRSCAADPEFGNGEKPWKNLSDAQQSHCFVKYRVPFIPGKLALKDSLEGSGSSGSSLGGVEPSKPGEKQTDDVKQPTGSGETPSKEEPANKPNTAKNYIPKKISPPSPPEAGAIGETPSDAYTIGDVDIPSKGNIGGVGIGSGDEPVAVSFSPSGGGAGPGGAQVAQAPAGLDVETDVDEDTGDVEVTINPDDGDLDTDTPIEIIVDDDSYQFYPVTDISAPKAPRSGAEKAALGILFVLLTGLAVLGWIYYKGQE